MTACWFITSMEYWNTSSAPVEAGPGAACRRSLERLSLLRRLLNALALLQLLALPLLRGRLHRPPFGSPGSYSP